MQKTSAQPMLAHTTYLEFLTKDTQMRFFLLFICVIQKKSVILQSEFRRNEKQ